MLDHFSLIPITKVHLNGYIIRVKLQKVFFLIYITKEIIKWGLGFGAQIIGPFLGLRKKVGLWLSDSRCFIVYKNGNKIYREKNRDCFP